MLQTEQALIDAVPTIAAAKACVDLIASNFVQSLDIRFAVWAEDARGNSTHIMLIRFTRTTEKIEVLREIENEFHTLNLTPILTVRKEANRIFAYIRNIDELKKAHVASIHWGLFEWVDDDGNIYSHELKNQTSRHLVLLPNGEIELTKVIPGGLPERGE